MVLTQTGHQLQLEILKIELIQMSASVLVGVGLVRHQCGLGLSRSLPRVH